MMTAPTTRRRYFVVDVFSDRPFRGNPVAVVVDAEGMGTEGMQRIAQWLNLSETTFCLPPATVGADYRLRIFTPKAELPFAGHPTLGSVQALYALGRLAERDTVIQECGAGLIPIQRDEGVFRFRLPAPRVTALDNDQRDALQQALGMVLEDGLPHLIDVGPKWVVARLHSTKKLCDLQPDLGKLARLEESLGATGVTVFAAADTPESQDIEVRSFAPSQGVPEDPVCGSGNGAVAVFRRDVESFGAAGGYRAKQGAALGRDGHVEVHFIGSDEIWIGGKSVVTAEGFLNCDEFDNCIH